MWWMLDLVHFDLSCQIYLYQIYTKNMNGSSKFYLSIDSAKENNEHKSLSWRHASHTAQKMKFSIKDFFSKCDQIRSFLLIWSHLLKKSLMENFIFLKCHLWKWVLCDSLGRLKKLKWVHFQLFFVLYLK